MQNVIAITAGSIAYATYLAFIYRRAVKLSK